MALVMQERQPLELTFRNIHENLSQESLLYAAVSRNEGVLTKEGILTVDTTPDTGRSADAKYMVNTGHSPDIDFGGVNKPMNEEQFGKLVHLSLDHLQNKDDIFSQDASLGADGNHNFPVHLISENAWATLFTKHLFRDFSTPSDDSLLILHAPSLDITGKIDGITTDRAIALHPEEGILVVAGTKYGGEIKKGGFTYAQYRYPKEGIATLHCSAIADKDGNTALFFGLSGTGKTTLATGGDGTYLIGDDEHGWSDNGIFNFERGSYAKVIRLSQKDEPLIWNAVHKRGTIIENARLNKYGEPIFEDGIDNMRAAFSLSQVENASESGVGDHPNKIFFLTADASGVMPVAAKLTPEQIALHYLSGYTSKIPGTEKGVTVPMPEFSACYGKPFLVYDPVVYTELLLEKIKNNGTEVWLVNTGWPGGYGRRDRLHIPTTRAVVQAILTGNVSESMHQDRLGFFTPDYLQGVPSEILDTTTYFTDEEDFRNVAKSLSDAFQQNTERFAGKIPPSVANAIPKYR